jgi:hypothetical protein
MDTGGLGASDWRGTARKRQCLHVAPARDSGGGARWDWRTGAKAAAQAERQCLHVAPARDNGGGARWDWRTGAKAAAQAERQWPRQPRPTA